MLKPLSFLLTLSLLSLTALAQETQAPPPPSSADPTPTTRRGGGGPPDTLPANPKLPTLWIIGDSTVRNGQGNGSNGQWGWGSEIATFFDTGKINVVNRALGGTSSRTFQTMKWEPIAQEIKPGDFVLMQFGHNDGIALNDAQRARGTIRGIGEESEEIDNMLTHKHEVVHTFGWYMAKYVKDTKAKGATPIVCSLIPRAPAKVAPATQPTGYQLWAQQVAEREHADYIDLNTLIMKAYAAENLSPDEIKTKYFTSNGKLDTTHTNLDGAVLNAKQVVQGIKDLPGDHPLKKFLKP